MQNSGCYYDGNYYEYRKNRRKDKIWWLDIYDHFGLFIFSFDKKKIYNLFADCPHNLTPEQVELFDKENPYWADFFKDRKR